MNMQKVRAIGLSALLAGCATSGPTGSEIITGSVKPNAARIVIYRTSAFGLAIQPAYKIDGASIASSTPNGFIACEVKPGRHEVSVDNLALNVNLFGGSDKATVDLAPGTTAFFSAQPQPGLTIGIITLTQVTENQGRSDTAQMHKLDVTCVGT